MVTEGCNQVSTQVSSKLGSVTASNPFNTLTPWAINRLRRTNRVNFQAVRGEVRINLKSNAWLLTPTF
jgi:hypothetical protein